MANPAISKNATRRAKYAAMSGEHDKSARNTALEQAMAQGAANVTAHDVIDGFTKITVEDLDGEVRRVRVPNVVERKAIIVPDMPTMGPRPGSRSAKRAAMKARRSRKIRTIKHRLGPCGNIGCASCRKVRP